MKGLEIHEEWLFQSQGGSGGISSVFTTERRGELRLVSPALSAVKGPETTLRGQSRFRLDIGKKFH